MELVQLPGIFFEKVESVFDCVKQYIEQEFSHPKFYPQTFEKLDCFGVLIHQLSKYGIQLQIFFKCLCLSLCLGIQGLANIYRSICLSFVYLLLNYFSA